MTSKEKAVEDLLDLCRAHTAIFNAIDLIELCAGRPSVSDDMAQQLRRQASGLDKIHNALSKALMTLSRQLSK